MDFAYLANQVLRTFNKYKCVNGTSIMACYTSQGKERYEIMQYDEGRLQLHTQNPDENGQYQCVTAIIKTQQLSMEMCRDEDERQKWMFEKKVIGSNKF